MSVGFEGPTSLRMAFSLMPSRCAIGGYSSLVLQPLDRAQTLCGDPSSTATPTHLSGERRHPAPGKAPLVSAHGTHRSAKRSRDVRLPGEALLHQKHHRIKLGSAYAAVWNKKFQAAFLTVTRPIC